MAVVREIDCQYSFFKWYGYTSDYCNSNNIIRLIFKDVIPQLAKQSEIMVEYLNKPEFKLKCSVLSGMLS